MVGGAYLCFEGAEKVLHKIFHGAEEDDDTPAEIVSELSSKDHEATMISGAIRTDFILSAEIMVISLKEILKDPQFSSSVWMQAFSLAVVAIAITIVVYGFVGLIVKMDDFGLHMAQRNNGPTRAIGRGLVTGMPKLLTFLSVVGTAAMLWVGGQIIIHGLHIHPAEYFGLHTGALAWLTDAAICGIFGLALGSAIAGIMHVITGIRKEDEVTEGI
jgi:predicted DNA repair protein MutK